MNLMSFLSLQRHADDVFTGVSPPTPRGRIFGGLVVAQALVAAQETVLSRPVHSLHAYFLRPGDPRQELEYRVENLRDGGSFSARRVRAAQAGGVILEMLASFQEPEAGFEHSLRKPEVPGPDQLENLEQLGVRLGSRLPEGLESYFSRKTPFELRPVSVSRFLSDQGAAAREPTNDVWVRCLEPIPQFAPIQRAALAYISDMTLLHCTLVAHGRTVFDQAIQAASLDHAMWFHRSFHPNKWHLYSQESPAAGAGRGLARGFLFSESGELVASVAQEGLIRRVVPKSASTKSSNN